MKTIGLIGGMSWESTLPYYRYINEGVKQRLGGLHSARLVLYSVDFHDIESLQRGDRWDESGVVLAEAGRALAAAGADFLVLCTNTMHRVADAIETGSGLPLLHIADATAAAIGNAGLSRVGLLGTRFTMEQPFYRERLAASGIDVLVPDTDDRAEVHRVIYEELCVGVVSQRSRDTYRDVIAGLVADGAQAIVLGCTEIGLLVMEEDASVPLFDTARIHAQRAVEVALG
jgi:aspartate racemase